VDQGFTLFVTLVLFRVGASATIQGTLRMRFRVAIEPVNRDRSAINSEQSDSALASTYILKFSFTFLTALTGLKIIYLLHSLQ